PPPPRVRAVSPYTTLFRSLAVLGFGVGLRVNDHCLDAEFAAGALDAKCDLAAIGDQELLEHVIRSRTAVGRTPPASRCRRAPPRSEEHTSELQSRENLVCR